LQTLTTYGCKQKAKALNLIGFLCFYPDPPTIDLPSTGFTAEIVRDMNKTTLFPVSLALLTAVIGCNPGTSSSSAHADEDTADKAVTTVRVDTGEDLATAGLLGELIVVSSGFQELGFSEAEQAAMVEGFKKALAGGSSRDLMETAGEQVRDFMQSRHESKAFADRDRNKKAAAAYVEELKKDARVIFTESGLGYSIKNPGEFEKPTLSDAVSVNYRGTLIDGTEFDAAMDPQWPATFPLAGVIPGFSEGLQKIGKGGEIRLYIPSELGYGDNPRPGSPIQAGAMLVFDVTMRDIQKMDAPAGMPDLSMPPPMPEEGEEAPESAPQLD
jgi:FKBP-type peptidyl-prolyl cis-trans isomerase